MSAATPGEVLARAAWAARAAYEDARRTYGRAALGETVAMGADGTPTMRIDTLVEEAILAAVTAEPLNVLSEETGFVDRGSAATLVVDPLDGSANGAAGVPLTAFSGAIAVDGVFTEALTVWLDTGRAWSARHDRPAPFRTSGRRDLRGAAISLLRPHTDDPSASEAWWAVASAAARVRILSTTCLEAALVAEGATDAFADARSDTHRLVDLAAAVVLVTAAGGTVRDALGRPVEFDTDLTRRWSGVVAATPDLAAELCATLRGRAPNKDGGTRGVSRVAPPGG